MEKTYQPHAPGYCWGGPHFKKGNTKEITEKNEVINDCVGNATVETVKKCGMVNVDGLTHFEPGQTNQKEEQ